METFDAAFAITAGGWDARYARVLAVASRDGVAAALVDTNGDGADVDLDQYAQDPEGHWSASVSGNVGDTGSTWSDLLVAAWGRRLSRVS